MEDVKSVKSSFQIRYSMFSMCYTIILCIKSYTSLKASIYFRDADIVDRFILEIHFNLSQDDLRWD